MSLVDNIVAAAKQLEMDGCRAICANCGFFGHYQKIVADQLDVPCYLSSMVQVPWALVGLKSNQKLGIMTANKNTLTKSLFEACGINVVELSRNIGVNYNNGPNTVTYFCIILF